MTLSYREAGVDLAVAERIAGRLAARLGTGLFGGFLPVPELREYDEPVLISSIDGVGTKVRLAALLDRPGGLGEDLVHHCVNDIAVHGARPLLFLDYLAFHRLEAPRVERIVASIADACSVLGIALAGGETAEMPLVYGEGSFDMAGAIVGVAERSAIVDGSAIRAGDVLLGLESSGLHTNGYSLVQRVFSEADYRRYEPALGRTLGEALLEPHRCYLQDIGTLLATDAVHGLAHITGGGIDGNLERIVPTGLQATVSLPPPPPLFALLESAGIDSGEMRRVFNMGIGLVAVCDRSIQSLATERLPGGCHVLGEITQNDESARRVMIRDDH
ncbi:MAG TPA: phosphoribosylformylglycinamidine cyclo-ligase [Chloroflexota bacterium]|nr:phosphoribosylformylglycinamidine cyclo-ligase [Chloroflexota bacterium]